jgi:uncharacterized protein
MTDTPNAETPETETPTPDAGGGMSKDERMWGMLCHLAAFLGLIIAIPFGSALGPLIIWLIKKEEFDFVADQGKEALNFQITMGIAGLVCVPFIFVGIGFLMILVVAIANVVLTIMAAMKANEGVAYRYPFGLKLVK